MKTSLYTRFFLLLASCFVLLACSDEENTEPATSLATPVITIGEVTSTSIDFSWAKVEGARQYGYRVTSPDGKDVSAGVTTALSVSVAGLTPFTTYTLTVAAFPEITGTANASETVMDVPTAFYDAIQNCATEYVSKLQANVATVTNRGTINEDRSGADYVEGWYGVFTISKFCGVNNCDMVFRVNRNNTITILNGEGYDEDGLVKLKTGKSSSATLSFDYIYIDESSSMFYGPNRTLTFTAKNNGTGNKLRVSTEETITWSEPEE